MVVTMVLAANLLANPELDFHSFDNFRNGKRENYRANNVAFWNTQGPKDISVLRTSHVKKKARPATAVPNMVKIAPGKKIWQFFTLPEAKLAYGDQLKLSAGGYQSKPSSLKAKIKIMKVEADDGEWAPADFGMGDKRKFLKRCRGELVVAKEYEAVSPTVGSIELKIDNAEVVGKAGLDKKSSKSEIDTVGIIVEIENTSKDDKDVWFYAPILSKMADENPKLLPGREMVPYYRHLPRTIKKLWKGEPVHIIVMGSSIDRGSANPPMYPYDEDPKSEKFKQPLSDCYNFNTELVGRPELNDYYGDSRHYFSYAGRLKRELMNKFNLPADKICLNFMACDGSCIGEAHSGLKEYFSLSLPPDPGLNGHKSGKTWQELYPDLFKRPEGPRPDLVIFGSGANEKTDTPDEVAVFEGAMRWIQRHYPNTEFVFCMFQNCGLYTPNTGDLEALALNYQIPYLDYGKVADELTRWCGRYAFVPRDGHPQAVSHYVWFKQLEKAFETWSPIVAGQAQLQLPERIHQNTYGWEGDMITFDKKSKRLKGDKFIFEDTAINCWGDAEAKDKVRPVPYVDGKKQPSRRIFPGRDIRNSFFRHGRCSLGDRHVLEIKGKNAKLTYVDAKVCPNRRFLGVNNPLWQLPADAKIQDFKSEWGAPYGSKFVVLKPGEKALIDVICTDISVAYVDQPKGGAFRLSVDGNEKLVQKTNVPFKDLDGKQHFMENRKGILNLKYGLHTVSIEAEKAPIQLLGIFTYDSRSNRKNERCLAGQAYSGETIRFTLPFKTRPLVICSGGLEVENKNIKRNEVKFSGKGQGSYQIIGE